MHRRTFDALMSVAGLILTVVLLVAGGLMLWAHNFVESQVSEQLTAQKIFFPPKGNEEYKDPDVAPIEKYAGQQLTTGQQARGYAENFIGVHLKHMAGGKTYAELSSEAQADPDNQELAGKVNTLFKGETLKGLLLNAYAFSQMGVIALYGAIAAFVGAALMLILSLLGLRHSRKAPADDTVMVGGSA